MSAAIDCSNDCIHNRDIRFMRAALQQAESALTHGEVPVGCVFVTEDDRVISQGFNLTNQTRNGTRHAEVVAMDKLIFEMKEDPRIMEQCTLYVTCEPCIMCAAAIAKVGVKRVVFGCHNDRFGGNGSILSIHDKLELNENSYTVVTGVMKEEAVELFQRFYESENRRAPEAKRKKKSGPS